jgi:murein hydrolase activator
MLKYIFYFLLLLSTSLSWGQDEERQRKLEAEKERLQREIRAQEQLLQKEKKKEKSAVGVVIQQTTKINLQQKLINVTSKQAKVLANSMYINQVNVNNLNKDLKTLKEDYAKMIVKSYKSRSEQSRAMFLLSSENFLQAYKRAQYMKQYASYRKMQGEEIKTKTNELQTFHNKLSAQKQEKVKLLSESEKQKQELEKQKREQLALVNSIKKDKNKIIADIKKKQKESKAIERQIDRLIRESIAAANKKVGNTTNTTTFVLTPEAKALAVDFKSNRGSLPWPVEKGLLTKKFGKQPHPLEPTIMIESSGIEISSENGAKARSVFAGEVSDVQAAGNGTSTVMIRHGDYTTTYSNIGRVYVKRGDKVTLKQSLGEIYFNPITGKAILKFLIFQNTTKLNPQSWIVNM